MAIKDMQLRGHCQCCGNQQAVVKGYMSKHGYTVEHGWFQGVCQGQHFAPMEQSRAQTDLIVAAVRTECAELNQQAADLRAGKIFPAKCKSGKRIQVEDKKRPGRMVWDDEYIAFKDGEDYYQREAVEGAAWRAESRARQGLNYADYLEKVANDYHGKDLMQVAKKEPAKYINKGEKKQGAKYVLIADYQDGARVYFHFIREDGKTLRSWMGSTSWRKLADVA